MWRRSRELFGFQMVLDIVLVVVLGPALLTGGDLNPVRCLERNRPFTEHDWAEHTKFQPTQSDLVLQFHPWWAAAREQLLAGRMPLVADSIGGGLPLLANGQTGIWAPVMAPVWIHGPERGTTIMALWKLELAGLGAYLFFSAWRLRWSAATLGGIAYAGGAYQIAWLLVPLSWVTAALPWLWWMVLAALRRRARLWLAMAAGGCAGWLLGCGLHPETAVVVIGSAALAAVILHPKRWLRLVALLSVAVLVAVALSWPTIAYISSSARMDQTRSELPNSVPVPAGWRSLAMRQMVLPSVNGHPGRGDWRAPFSYAPAATGVGGLAVGLLFVGKVRRRYRRFVWTAFGCLAVAALCYFRLPPFDSLLVRVPPLDRMTLPRFAALVPWGLSVWAALALDGALAGKVRRGWWLVVGVVAAGLVAVFSQPTALDATSHLLLLLTVVSMAAARLLIAQPRRLATVVALELAVYSVGVNPVAAVEDRMPRPAIIDRAVQAQQTEGGRIIGIEGVLPSNLAGRYGMADLRAYDPVRPAPYARFMALLGQRDPVLGGALRSAPPGLCGAWSVRFLLAPSGSEVPGWQYVASGDRASLWRNPKWLPEVRVVGRTVEGRWPRLTSAAVDYETTAVVPPGTPAVAAEQIRIEVLQSIGTRVEADVVCDGPCLVVVAQPWAPGWRVRVDGEPADLVRANLAGLGALVPAGRHRVLLSYHPWRAVLDG
jgi:hypothetical protein